VTEHSDKTATKIHFDNDSKRVLWLFVDRNSRDFNAHIDTLTDVALAFRADVRRFLSAPRLSAFSASKTSRKSLTSLRIDVICSVVLCVYLRLRKA